MVYFAPLVGAAALYAGFASAAPMPDSAIGQEVAVSAPNGVIMSDTAAASQTGSAMGSMMTSGSMMGGSSYGSGSGYSSGSSMYGGGSNMYGGGSSSMMYGGSGNMYGGGSSSMVSETMMTSAAMATSTSAAMSYSTPSYGSGGSMWGSSGYSSCVQQCVASYGSPMATYMPSSTMGSSSGSSGSSGSGTTHTVIVAPTQGVLRYVPFALNASVGDTVKFMWGANNHTVTKSSELTPCNKTSDAPFASGEQNKSFTFTQVVNDTSPTFFYCGTPGHCEKGMFGIINPPNAAGASTSVGAMMASMTANSSSMAAMASYTMMQTSNNSAAAMWGTSIDMSQMPQWAQQYVAQNVMYTQTFLAANPETLSASGNVDLSQAGSTPMMIPMDITQVMSGNNAANSTSAPAASSATSSAAASSSGTAKPASAASKNGAGSLASPRVVVGLVVAAVTFFSL